MKLHNQLRAKFDEMMNLYQFIKQEVKIRDPRLYERWKVGGFLIDEDIMSMYPTLETIIGLLDDEEPEENPEES